MNDVVLESIQLDLIRDFPSEIADLSNENLNLKNIKRGLTTLLLISLATGAIIYYKNDQKRRSKQNR